jgi:uncharacterized protein YjbJ (UPF0337 family)
MSGDIFTGKMKQIAGNIKAEWSDITDTDLQEIENKEQLE